MYYGPTILLNCGFGDASNLTITIIDTIPLAGANMVAGIVAIFYIDKWGRR